MMRRVLIFSLMFVFVFGGCEGKREGHALSVDNVAISYHVEGKGEVGLVFVHGWCCDKSYWKFQVPYFAKRYKVVTIDLAGHGESGLGRVDYTIEAFGEDVAAVVKKLGLGKVVLVGHSLGGPVIIEAARLMPGRVTGCVGVDTLHDIGKGYSDKKAGRLAVKLESDFVGAMQSFARGAFRADAEAELVEWVVEKMSSVNAEVGVGLMEHIGEYDLKEAVKDVEVPIVCINSDFWPTNVEGNGKYARIYEVKMMPGLGHFVMMEDAETFNMMLAETVSEMSR